MFKFLNIRKAVLNLIRIGRKKQKRYNNDTKVRNIKYYNRYL